MKRRESADTSGSPECCRGTMVSGAAAGRKEGQMNYLNEMMAWFKKLMGGAKK